MKKSNSPLDIFTVKTSLDRRTEKIWVAEVSQKDGVEVSMGDLGEDEYYSPFLTLTNNSSETVSVKVTAVYDGKSQTWNDAEIRAQDYHSFSLDKMNAMPQEGSHTIVWSVNGQEVARFSWTVKKSNSPLDIFTVKISLGRRTDKGLAAEVSQKDGVEASMGDLGEDEYYSPYLTLTNNSSETVTVKVTAVYDGKSCTWGDTEIKALKGNSFSLIRKTAMPQEGSHTIVWSVNGQEVASFSWTVKKSNSPLDIFTVETSLDRKTDKGWVAEVSQRDGVEVSMGALGEDEYYSPYLMLINNSQQAVAVKVTAVYDGKSQTWSDAEINALDYSSFSLSRKNVTPQMGSHTIVWSVNGQEVARFNWTVKK